MILILYVFIATVESTMERDAMNDHQLPVDHIHTYLWNNEHKNEFYAWYTHTSFNAHIEHSMKYSFIMFPYFSLKIEFDLIWVLNKNGWLCLYYVHSVVQQAVLHKIFMKKAKMGYFLDFLPEFGQHSMTSSLVPTPAALVCNWAIDCCAMIVVHRIADENLDDAEEHYCSHC